MRHKWLTGGGLGMALALFVALNIVAQGMLGALRLDVTENGLFTLSKGTRNILQGLEEPVTLRLYFSARLFSGVAALQNYGIRIRDLLEEYAAASNGMLRVKVIDPEPFSEAEDQAVKYGITQIPLGTGERGYLGLVGSGATDAEASIPFFALEKERSLEYDLTKLIYGLANPKKRVIGAISTLPVFGGFAGMQGDQPQFRQPWTIATHLQEVMEVRPLGDDVKEIPKDVDTLLVIHPKDLPEQTRYRIDQFVLKGGKAMVLVDPLSEEDRAQPNPEQPGVPPKTGSDLPDLFEKWGLRFVKDKIASDLEAALEVAYNGPTGPRQSAYLPWLRMGKANLNREDFITSELNTLNLAAAGILEPVEGATTRFTPLISTGKQSMPLERMSVVAVRDPASLLEGFKPAGKVLVLAARISGKVKTAFPNGMPGTDTAQKEGEKPGAKAQVDPDFIAESRGPINVVVVADTDLLADRFWVKMQSFLGINVPSAISDNANLVINALENLGGNDDLISLRSRGEYARPFTRVEALQRGAESRFRERERELQAKLEETEQKIQQLQTRKAEGSALLLSPEQKRAIEQFRQEQVKTRKALRAVQHDLRKNIERLGTQLRFANMGLIPLLIAVLAIGVGMARMRKRPG
ncbi:MAG: Gldg family protein [Gammaproteobacteria bacterium]